MLDRVIAFLRNEAVLCIAFVFACVSIAVTGDVERSTVTLELDERAIDKRRFALHAGLFALSALAVMRVVPYQAALLVVAPALFLFDRRVFAQVDYALLATFVCFFVFSGNMANMPAMQEFLGGLMATHPMLTSLVTSQVISNVPAAVLLSGFTVNWHSLLIGVDPGGSARPSRRSRASSRSSSTCIRAGRMQGASCGSSPSRTWSRSRRWWRFTMRCS